MFILLDCGCCGVRLDDTTYLRLVTCCVELTDGPGGAARCEVAELGTHTYVPTDGAWAAKYVAEVVRDGQAFRAKVRRKKA